MNNEKKCFVIMPFSRTKSCTEEKWAEIFEYIIKPAVEESGLGYECERSVAERENIIKGILEALNRANVVIADLTDNNPNVFYELGVRHTLTNRTILIAQGKEHIPFDLRQYPVAFYSESPAKIAEFKSDIKRKLKDIETNPERSDNPVADFLKERNVVLLSTQKSENCKKLNALVSELSHNTHAVDDILDEVEKSEQARKIDETKFRVSAMRFTYSCLELLLSTSYLVLPQKLLRDLNFINEEMRIINGHLDLWGQPSFTKEVEKKLKEGLPRTKQKLTSLLGEIGKLRIDYINDNYHEPAEPNIVLSSPEHEKYLKPIGQAK